jgi:hypothetical protein
MNVTILNGDPEAGSGFCRYLAQVAERLGRHGHDVHVLELREMDIRGCRGCWGCWVKTPGECVQRDDSATVCREVLASDLTLFASPVRMGFVSALLKRTTDKLIPLVHPYIVIEGGEMHHRARYDRYPLMGLLLGAGPGSDAEDIEITTEIWARTARNLKTRLVMTVVADRSAEEVANELASVA